MAFKPAPLSGSFMLFSMLGLLISTMYINKFSMPWAFAIGILSFCMLIASFISMTNAPVEEELKIDEHHKIRKSRIKVKGNKK